jgi:acyl-CoA reductase-like NAD-dependent aldehyde dehydrogenase
VNAKNASRLAVKKTYKLFIGGGFLRSESGRVATATSTDGKTLLDNYALASRKDFRDAVVKARAAQPKWASSSAYLRGQILYRMAEIMESRRSELEHELTRSRVANNAADEVSRAIDLVVHYAGWTDKFSQVFSSVNPVASAHFNFSFPEPTGVVAIIAPDAPALLGLVGTVLPAVLSGNSSIALASSSAPLVAVAWAEIIATSDLPGGVINLLTGDAAELAPHFASHMDVNAVVTGRNDAALNKVLQSGTAENLKRFANHSSPANTWKTAPANPYWILDTIETKTAWHPMGV